MIFLRGASSATRRKVFQQLAGGVVVVSLPIAVWYKSASDQRHVILERFRTKPTYTSTLIPDRNDILIQRMQPGDVLLFDRNCSKCASGPWAALACLVGRAFLCDDNKAANRSVDHGKFDHIGIVVPGYIRHRADEYDPTNLLLLEATPSGIVARPLQDRLECTQSRSIIFLPLCSPGEVRHNVYTVDEDADSESEPDQTPSVVKTRAHITTQLTRFRDRWIDLGKEKKYANFHSTVALGGAFSYALGLHKWAGGPVSPSAYLVLLGLQQAAVAQNINEKDNLSVKVEDFLRDYRVEETNAVRLRPGFRFLAPISVRETARS
ncbi:hypothetical protein MPSEU_000271900 [Mayamaea pseudoterrestris]|nr:hypothetical protein MPSEU_000271900 [Mayamaea pseudoterrestris]